MKTYTTGEVMKALREKVNGPRGKTQKQVAAELGVTPQYLNDILGENRRLTPEVAAALGFIKQPDRYSRSKPEAAYESE
jgi:plasmid maintenance system antidote protein VapI